MSKPDSDVFFGPMLFSWAIGYVVGSAAEGFWLTIVAGVISLVVVMLLAYYIAWEQDR